MLIYPNINPIALKLGPVQIHWYGIMYLIGFFTVWWLGNIRTKKPNSPLTSAQLADLIFYGAIGVIVGGRLGYVFFYDLPHFIATPWSVFAIWQGGMSFHGGLIGVILAIAYFAYKFNQSFFSLTDFVAPLVLIGLGAGRIGNFINGELWGRVTTVPWGMVFPTGGPLPRHPSQLYEFFLEGIVLFILLWWYSSHPRPRMAVSGMFLILYGSFRFSVEFFRQPDVQLSFIAWDWLTMGQLLSFPMIILGFFLLFLAYKRRI